MKKKGIWISLSILLVLGLLLGSFGCQTSAPAPSPAPTKPAPTTATPTPTAPPKPAELTPIAGVKMPQDLVMIPVQGTGTIYDVMMGFVIDLLKTGFPEVRVRTLPGSSKDAILAVQKGDAQIGFCTAVESRQAYNGEGTWATPHTNLRVMTRYAYQSMPVLMVPADSPIKTLADVKGKRIGIGPPAGFGGVLFLDILQQGYGISREDIEKAGGRVVRTAHDEEARLVASGELDGAVYFGHPAPFWTEVVATRSMRFIGASEDAVKKTIAYEPPGLVSRAVMPANIYKGQDYEVVGVSQRVMFLVRADVPDDVVYNIMTVWFSDSAIKNRLRTDKRFDFDWVAAGFDVMATPPFPMHPGAEKYWIARGYKK